MVAEVAGGVIMTHNGAVALPPTPCYSQRPRESAVGGLDGRQRQDAAIVGVQVLRVAPRPENRQQGE